MGVLEGKWSFEMHAARVLVLVLFSLLLLLAQAQEEAVVVESFDGMCPEDGDCVLLQHGPTYHASDFAHLSHDEMLERKQHINMHLDKLLQQKDDVLSQGRDLKEQIDQAKEDMKQLDSNV